MKVTWSFREKAILRLSSNDIFLKAHTKYMKKTHGFRTHHEKTPEPKLLLFFAFNQLPVSIRHLNAQCPIQKVQTMQ